MEAGDTDAKPKLGQRLLDGIGDDNWDTWRFIDVGQFLPLARLEPANLEDDDLDRLYQDGTIPDARINDVLNGGGLHDTELTFCTDGGPKQWCKLTSDEVSKRIPSEPLAAFLGRLQDF